MTVAAPDYCWWYVDQGAPAGPEFDVLVPSSRAGRQPYRIARGADGIAHFPRCEAFAHGHRMCRHIKAAIEQAEQPASVFLARVGELYDTTIWWGEGDVPPIARGILTETKRALDEARAQLARNADGARARAASEAFRSLPAEEQGAQAIRELGGVQ